MTSESAPRAAAPATAGTGLAQHTIGLPGVVYIGVLYLVYLAVKHPGRVRAMEEVFD